MKKKISPGVFLTAFALSLFMSMSLKNLEAQVLNNPAAEPVGIIGGGAFTRADEEQIVRTNPTGTGGTIGVTPLTATGGTIGATATTATGVPMGATTTTTGTVSAPIVIQQLSPEQLQGTGFKPKIQANECLQVGGGAPVCGDEAMNFCRIYPEVESCKLLIKNRL